MKLTCFLLVAFFMQVSAASFAQKVTLQDNHITLKELFKEIRKQTGYDVLFQSGTLNTATVVKADFKDTPLKEVMEQSLQGQALDFVIDENTVIIKKKETNFIDKAKAFFAQITISGKVTDETGQPLPGVTVKIKASNLGVITDQKGVYMLTVPDGKTIISFSFIGFESQELTATDIAAGSTITLKATQTNLREVVVSKGYYDEKRELSTGNVGLVTSKEIEKQPVTDPLLALEGRVAGLQITQASGVPGAYSTVQLRGQNFIPSAAAPLGLNNPLYILDGIPITSASLTGAYGGGATGAPVHGANLGLSPFNNLNPSDIESIEILKDADATAIYGSRGANGVILITTKKGKAGTTKVQFNINHGIGQVTNMVSFLNTQQYLAMRQEAFKNGGNTPGTTDYDINGTWDTTRYTNWEKILIGGTSQLTNAEGSISGGNSNTQFLISGGYTNQTTVYPGDFGDQKASLHFNLNHTSDNQKFRAQFSAIYVNDNSNLPTADYTSSITLAPDAPPPFMIQRAV